MRPRQHDKLINISPHRPLLAAWTEFSPPPPPPPVHHVMQVQYTNCNYNIRADDRDPKILIGTRDCKRLSQGLIIACACNTLFEKCLHMPQMPAYIISMHGTVPPCLMIRIALLLRTSCLTKQRVACNADVGFTLNHAWRSISLFYFILNFNFL